MTGDTLVSGEPTPAARRDLMAQLPREEVARRRTTSPSLRALVEADVQISQLTTWHPDAETFAHRIALLGPVARRKTLAVILHSPKPILFADLALRTEVASLLASVKVDAKECTSTGVPALSATRTARPDLLRLAKGGWLEVYAASAAREASPAVIDAQVGAVYSIEFSDRTHRSEFDAVVMRSDQLTIVEAKAGTTLLERGRTELVKAIDNFSALERWRLAHSFAKTPRFRLLLPVMAADRVERVRQVVAAHGYRGLVAVRTTDDYDADFRAKRAAKRNSSAAA